MNHDRARTTTEAGPGPATSTEPDAVVLDNRGVPCATGLLRVRDTIAQLDDGQLLDVRSRDRFAPVEIPLWAERAGHEVISITSSRRWLRQTHRIVLRRRDRHRPVQPRTPRDGPLDK